MAYVSMKQMLETGVHFGHQTRRWNPKMRPYIFGARNGIHIIDLQQTVKLFRVAYDKVVDTVAKGGKVLFIGTKRQAQEEAKLNQEQKKLLENYLRLAEGNLPLNQLYVDLNNEEQVNVRKEKDAEREAIETVETILANISDSPMRDAQIHLIMQTDPFCNYRNIVDMLAKELDS